MKKVFKAFAIAAAVVVALVACKKEDQPKEVALTGIELNATSQTLQVGQEFQLTVTYKPENATSKPAASWASDAPAVATVDGGKVVAVAAGTAKITATVGTFTAECAITVASAEEEILPVEGNSAWSVIGSLLGKSWDTDFVCAEENGAFVLKNVKLAKGNEIKFRKDKDWTVNRGINKENEAAELAAGTPTKAIQGGGNIIIPADGIYDLYYFAEKEAIVYVAKDAALPEIPDFTTPEPQGIISIDGDFSDWAEIESVGTGTHAAFKVAVDDNYLYVYTKRIKGEGEAASGYEEMWGHASEGYIYLALDLDKNPETGDMLWTNGPFEFVGYHYPFGGSAESPVINEKPGASTSCAPSSASTKNIFCKGVIGTDEVEIEYSIPRADLPAIPETPFIVYSWGSLGLDKVEYHVGEPQPKPEPAAPDWDNIASVTNGNHTLQFTTDGEYAWFRTRRTTEGRYSEIWGGSGYVYVAFELDNNAETGETLWGNGPYEFVGVLYPFGGSADSPAINETPGDACLPETATLANVFCKGVIDADGTTIEYRIPLADLPQLPEKFTVYSWGNKDLAKVVYPYPYEEPAAAAITLDGNFDDWADIEVVANTESNSIKEWKTTSDANNLYFYIKISRSDIKAEKSERPEGSGLFPFEKRRYIYIALNTDSDDTTGPEVPGSGDMTIPGAEVLSIIYPFRGNSTEASGTDGAEIVNGEDSNSYVKILDGGTKTGEKLSAYGVVDDDYGYMEISMPRAGASLAAGTYKVQFSLSSTLSHVFDMVVE